MTSPGLVAEIGLHRGALHLDARIGAEPGETVALLGPNGAGKTSALLAIAGLLPIETGRITLDSLVLDDPAAGVFLRPEHRGVGVVFQDHLLFPHMSVVENVAFGPRARGADRPAALAIAREWLERIGLADLEHRQASALSGGEAQRVAMARALAIEPDVLLLDEPLAALDVTIRAELRRGLAVHLGTFAGPRLLVTHDATEAFALADRVVVLDRGAVIQTGTPAELRRAPASRYVADLVGVNLVRGSAHRGAVTAAGGAVLVAAEDLSGEVLAIVHPRAISLFPDRPQGSPRNAWATVVVGIEPAGDRLRVQVDEPLPLVAEITGAARDALGLAVGSRVWVAIKASEVVLVPA